MNPILKKLRYQNQDPVLVLNAPLEFHAVRGEFPCVVHEDIRGKYGFALFFVRTGAEARAGLGPALSALSALDGDGVFWFCYPKGTSKRYRADIKRDQVWDLLQPYGFRPVAQVALDDDWSALRCRLVELVGQ